ncbi:hypothetical protein ABZ883_04940 [Streptomyces sp. NPDC046977]|uniref:hypothetical protein n=1 Tax=Streptomyces sp. NPDC046977 TaxID=3154703 RepID=UPI0033F7BF30
MPTPVVCPGSCNAAWRRAEHALATHGTPHDIPATWGVPVHCLGCEDRTRRHLTELPELLQAVTVEPLEGSRSPSAATMHAAPTDTTPWPGQSARLLVDQVAGGLIETAAELLRMRNLSPARLEAAGVREDVRIGRAIKTLLGHLAWLMQEHPLATESHEPLRYGAILAVSGNPAAQIAAWHRAATRFTHRDEAPETTRYAPCRRCGGPWLAEARDLRLMHGLPYIECRDPDCAALLTHAEYRDYVKELIKEGQAALEDPLPDGAPEESAA